MRAFLLINALNPSLRGESLTQVKLVTWQSVCSLHHSFKQADCFVTKLHCVRFVPRNDGLLKH